MTQQQSLWFGRIERQPTITEIIKEVAEAHGVTVERLLAPGHSWTLAHIRWEVMWRARQIKRPDGSYRYSLPYIGQRLGGRDHTTVLHGLRRYAKRFAEAAE